jgi:hypothetical protein
MAATKTCAENFWWCFRMTELLTDFFELPVLDPEMRAQPRAARRSSIKDAERL